jgi:hypothetical protein
MTKARAAARVIAASRTGEGEADDGLKPTGASAPLRPSRRAQHDAPDLGAGRNSSCALGVRAAGDTLAVRADQISALCGWCTRRRNRPRSGAVHCSVRAHSLSVVQAGGHKRRYSMPARYCIEVHPPIGVDVGNSVWLASAGRQVPNCPRPSRRPRRSRIESKVCVAGRRQPDRSIHIALKVTVLGPPIMMGSMSA